MTTKQKILDYLAKHPEGVTSMEGFEKRELRTTKLVTRINEMIAKGVPIVSEWEEDTDQNGKVTSRYKRYKLKSDPMDEIGSQSLKS